MVLAIKKWASRMKLTDVQLSFQKRFRRQLGFSGLGIVAVALIFVAERYGKQSGSKDIDATGALLLAGMVASLAGAAIGSAINWRCPSCNRYLGKRFSPAFCSHCGVQLKA